MQQARAEQMAAQARQRESEAQDDLSISLEARARWVQPPSAYSDESIDDHKGSLFVRKSLYDFGRTGSLQQAARSEAQAMAIHYQSQRDQHRIDIMRAFFDVLLADQENFRDNEAMAIAFITLDRVRNRQELGQSSDIEVLEQESHYQSVRYRVLNSESRQRITRSHLANLLNRPGDLPADLVPPNLNQDNRTLPEYEQLLELAMQHNPTLHTLQLELQAAQDRVSSARSEKLPYLDGELEASTYSRELGSSDTWRAGVTLSIPIYNGGRVESAVAVAQAEVMRLRGELTRARQELRQALLQSWFELQRLQRQREQAQSELDYRELYLDRSRANYEMEVKADLGDAMVRLSDAQLALIKNDFDTALAWEHLHAMLGVEPERLNASVTDPMGEIPQ
jgi:outer membrane protein TolC